MTLFPDEAAARRAAGLVELNLMKTHRATSTMQTKMAPAIIAGGDGSLTGG